MTKCRNIKIKNGVATASFKGSSMVATLSSFPKWFTVKRSAEFSLPRGDLLALNEYLNESKVFDSIKIKNKYEGRVRLYPRVLFTHNDLKAMRIIQAGLCCYQPVLKDKLFEKLIKTKGVFVNNQLSAYIGLFGSKEEFMNYLKEHRIKLSYFDFETEKSSNSKSKDASMFKAMKDFKDFQAQMAVAELIDINAKFSLYDYKITNISSQEERAMLRQRLWNVSRVYKKRISWLLSLVGKELDNQDYDSKDMYIPYFKNLVYGITHLRTIDYYMEMGLSDTAVGRLTK